MHDNTFFKGNMAVLEQRYPHLAAKVRTGVGSIYRYKIVRSQTGDPNVLVMRDMDSIFLYDNDNPFEYCRAYFEGLNIKFAPLVVFLGLGLGYHLHLFMRFYGERLGTKRIIVFEEDMGLFHLAMQLVDLQQVIGHPDIHLFVGMDPEDAYAQIRKDILPKEGTFAYMKSTKAISLPGHILLSHEYYMRVLGVMKKACCQTMILTGNDPIDSLVGLDNMLRNIKNIVSNPGIRLLFDKFEKRPAVIVGAGPSLNKNIHLLKDITERALVVSCDASFVPLMKRDIRPHIVVTMERTDGTEYFFEDAPDFEGVYLAICPIVRPKGFESFKGKKIIVNRTFSHFDWLGLDKGSLSFGPGVSHMAFEVAEALGCDPIILIGQDLAFAEDGKTHVKEMVFGECDDFYYGDVCEVEGNDGKTVKSSKTWQIFRAYLEEKLTSYQGLCINATEGGAKIRGTKVITFREAIARYCQAEFHPRSVIEESISSCNIDLEAIRDLEQLQSRIGGTLKSIEALIPVFRELHDDARRLHGAVARPFMYQGAELDREALLPIITKFLEVMDSYLNNDDVKDVMLHTLQPLLIWFYNRFNFLPEIYSDADCLLAARIATIKEWLGVVGQLLVLTMDSVDKAATTVTEELRDRYACA
jgi:hypothetical protein